MTDLYDDGSFPPLMRWMCQDRCVRAQVVHGYACDDEARREGAHDRLVVQGWVWGRNMYMC
jgi:hypothetical protein